MAVVTVGAAIRGLYLLSVTPRALGTLGPTFAIFGEWRCPPEVRRFSMYETCLSCLGDCLCSIFPSSLYECWAADCGSFLVVLATY